MSKREKRIGYLGLWLSALMIMHWQSSAQSSETLKFTHYTNQDGLPSSYVKDFEQDHLGFIWVANRENVCRFDGYNFQTFPATNANGETFNLKPNTLHKISDTLLLVRAIDDNFYRFSYQSESFTYYPELSNIGQRGALGTLIESDSGVWYVSDSLLWFSNLQTEQSHPVREINGQKTNHLTKVSLMDARYGKIAVVDWTNESGLIYLFGPKGQQSFELPSRSVDLIYLDSHDNLWVGDNENGLFRINIETGRKEFYSSKSEGEFRITHNYVYIIKEDQDGVLWMGTEGGISRWSVRDRVFSRSEFDLSDPNGLTSNPIYSGLCDDDGNMWLGSYFSGINLWSKNVTFFKTLSAGIGDHYLGGNAVSCFVEDEEGNLWVGLEDMGLNKIDPQSGKISKFPIGVAKGGLSSSNVHSLYFEDSNTLWIATYTGGINVLDVKSGTIKYFNTENTPNLGSNDVYAFFEVGDSVFVSTINGVSVFDKKNQQFHRFYPEVFANRVMESITEADGKIWFSSRTALHAYDKLSGRLSKFDEIKGLSGINFVKSDSQDRLWIGDSYKGLFCFNPKNRELQHFHNENGFHGNWIYSIQEGVNDWFWVATNEGMVKLDPVTGTSFLYDKDSGMPFGQFNYRAAFKDSKGLVYVGSNEGLLYFDENNQPLEDRTTDVVLTSLKLFNQNIQPETDLEILNQSLTLTDQIELKYKQNVFTVEFSSLNYINKGKCNYAYYLEGFEHDYNYVGNVNFATYTNLNPGTYTFKVKASFDNSVWPDRPVELQIVILPPFWLSKWGFFLYAAILVGILITISIVTSRIQKSKAQVMLERKERLHALELNQMKLEFFTNISHELRTPLTLIVGPLSALVKNEKVSPFVKDKLAKISINADRLIQLLNQLLEFRKIEQGKESLKVSEIKICEMFDNLEQSFAMTAEESRLRLTFDCARAGDPIWIDTSKVEKVLINLISNAFKFTEQNGSIEVIAEALQGDTEDDKRIRITVRDNGRGMESNVLSHIFERFYQSEDESGKEKVGKFGSGIGLSFVNSLVKLHKGTIRVKSKPNVGTIFKIELPVSPSAYDENEIVKSDFILGMAKDLGTPVQMRKPQPIEMAGAEGQGKPKILLVEDNMELLEFISSALADSYSIVMANNGQEALDKLSNDQVDLILSDVMMPVMDGFEFTNQVKTDIETSHIPVILLTAKGGVENRYEGLKTGADIYLEKPFLAHILEQNIRNVLNTRQYLVKKYKRDAYMPATELTHSESDKKFIDNLTAIIKGNIDKPDLDVSFLISELGLSRSMLHLKLKKLADCSATEFINTVRLKEAVKLMTEADCNVSEAAYRTGFSSPTYFTRRFKQYYGQSPRDFVHKASL